MSLKISLKPQERLIVGGAVLQNGGGRCDLLVENNVPILRQKDILGEKDANTPCKRIYFVIQLMYIDEKNLAEHHTLYWKLVKAVIKAAPSTMPLISQISELILRKNHYQALRKAKKLIEFEQEVTQHVRSST